MRLENCLEDMSVISNALATVTSSASRFSNAKTKAKSGRAFVEPFAYLRFRGTVKRTAKYTGFKEQIYVKSAGIPVQENSDATQLAEIENKLAELTAKHVRLAHAISGWKAEKIRSCFGESRYEELKNVDLTIRGLEGFVNKLIRDSEQPHPYLKRLSDSVTEYRLAISDLLLILNQCFNDADVIESQTGLIDEDVFACFSFH
ncbi:hypothetical protein [Citrobacter europaeus]|jgi:hypothetical protein|uniref:hypothetical protein n=1 Tax=Citrobacter europaeus TaxID=1914243 RepID=UPI00335E50C1